MNFDNPPLNNGACKLGNTGSKKIWIIYLLILFFSDKAIIAQIEIN